MRLKISNSRSRRTATRSGTKKHRALRREPDVQIKLRAQRDALLSAQAELEESRARYAELYDTAPVGFVTLSRAGLIEEINLTAARLLGFKQRQLLKQPLLMFMARHDRRKYLKYLSQLRCLPGRRTVEVELARRKDAPPMFIELVTIAFPELGRTAAYFQSALIDITARREAEAALRGSEERFRALASHAPVGIFLGNAKGDTRYVNEAWCAMTGFSSEQASGRGWLNAVHPDDRERVETGWNEAVRTGASSSAEFRFLRPDGEVVWVQGKAIQIKGAAGENTGCIGTIADITDRKRAEAELKRAHEETLAVSQAKDDFLAMLSHELRTPLNPVLLLAGDAARNRDLPPGVRADFDAIRKNVEMEARLIDDLLDLTRVTHGKLLLEKRELEVHDVLREAIATMQNEIENKKITLKLALNAKRHRVSADTVRLQQVFWNLLRNAVKFTPENGVITVETSLDGPRLTVRVTDTGVGISEGELEHIFEAFSQGARSGYGGLGLGLTISKKLVELHAGSIHATSGGKNCGAAFCVKLPLMRASKKSVRAVPRSPQASQPPTAGGKPARRSRVLLVEDHEPTRAALTRLLLHRRFEVTGAGSVAEARAFIDKSEINFDLLISDIGLPDGNGYDLMNHVRADVKGIALTGYGMEEDVQRSYAAGFTTHLTKPVKIELLDQALASILPRV